MLEVNKIHCGDVLEKLKELPDDFIDCIITSPPYWSLRSYLPKDHIDKIKEIGNEPTFKEYLDKMMLVFAEVKRILKPDGSFFLNMGDSYGGSLCGYGQTKENSGFQNINQGYYGTSQNVPLAKGFMEKSLLMQPARMAIRMQDEQDWILRADINWIKQILIYKKYEKYTIGSVMPSSVKDRVNMASEHLFHFVKNKKYFYDINAVRIPIQNIENRAMGIDREKKYPNAKRNKFAFNYRVRDAVKKVDQCPQFKASEEEIRKYNFSSKEGNRSINFGTKWSPKERNYNFNGKNIPNNWLIGSEHSKEHHYAKFPSMLCEIPILATCPKDGIVMDIFCGSGTALVVALKLGRNFVGIELNPKFIEIAEKRLKPYKEQKKLI